MLDSEYLSFLPHLAYILLNVRLRFQQEAAVSCVQITCDRQPASIL